MSMIELDKLSKCYKDNQAVDSISLTITEGIYGLIGKNGAGKTTLIRMLAGLIFPSSGEMKIDGKKDPSTWCKAREKMSFIVETPYIDPGMTAYENLYRQSMQKGIDDKKRIEEVLELVSLEGTGRKKAGFFSLGMRQRLGIAIALLNKPCFLILDEPLNGLDPEGIVDMRQLFLQIYKEQHMGLLISSHLLGELYQVADHYIFMDHGKVIEEMSADTLNKWCQDYLVVKVDRPEEGAGILREKLGINCSVKEDRSIHAACSQEIIGEASKILVQSGLVLTYLAYHQKSLEDYFMERIGGEKDEKYR